MLYTKNHPMMDKLGKAISEGDLPSVELICQNLPKGFNINTVFEHFLSGVGKGRQGKGHTPLTFSLQQKKHTITEYLIDHCGANVTVEGRFGSPLMTAIKVMNQQGINILLEHDEINSELHSSSQSSNILYQLQEMYTNNTGNKNRAITRENIISLSRQLIKKGANTQLLDSDDFLNKLEIHASTTPIPDLTSMSPTAAREIVERSSREFLDFTANDTNVSSTALPNHGIQNDTVNGTTGVNSTLIPSGKGSYATLPNHSILSCTGNDTIGVNRSDIPEVICSSDGIGSLISGIVGMVLAAGVGAGAYFGIKKYKENKNYTKALEMPTYDSSNSSTPLA